MQVPSAVGSVTLGTAMFGLGVWLLLTTIFTCAAAYTALRSDPRKVWLAWAIAALVLAAATWLRFNLTPSLAFFPARVYWSTFLLVVVGWVGSAWFVHRRRRRDPAAKFLALVRSGLLGFLVAVGALLIFPLLHDLRVLTR